MEPIRSGIIGTGFMGRAHARAVRSAGGTVVAFAGRDQDRTRATAQAEGVRRVLTPQELIDDPDVDLVHVCTPNAFHVKYAEAAIAAGKHVLCEKSFASNAVEAREMAEAADQAGLVLMDAFHYRYHPVFIRAKDIYDSGELGEIRKVSGAFHIPVTDPTSIRMIYELGGGVTMDIGCYPISLSRFIFGAEPLRVSAIAEFDPNFKTDVLSSAIMDFGNGTSTFTCSTQMAPYQRVQIFGDRGRVEIEIPFNAPPDKPCRLWFQNQDAVIEEIEFDICDQYTIQGDLFSRAILVFSNTMHLQRYEAL